MYYKFYVQVEQAFLTYTEFYFYILHMQVLHFMTAYVVRGCGHMVGENTE